MASLALFFFKLIYLWLGPTSSYANSDADALLDIKSHLGPDNPKLSSWTGNDPCIGMWQGVTCEAGSVTKLNLTEMQLVGIFPNEFGNLTMLEVLDLQNNTISGPIPDSFSRLSALRALNLSVNPIHGTLPSPIVSLSGLVDLRLDACNLTGSLPDSISSMTRLQFLYLSQNKIQGPVLSSIVEKLPRLVELSLWDNLLNSELPSSIGRLKNLRLLNLHDCGIQGRIPPDLGNLTKLESLYLHKNNLSGVLDFASYASWSQMKSLRELELYFNMLRGNFPTWLADLPNLHPDNIVLNCNYFTGPRPTNFPIRSHQGNCYDEDLSDGLRDHGRQCHNLGCTDFLRIFPRPPPAAPPRIPSPSPSENNKRIAPGAVVGISIASLSGAILTGALIFWICKRRKQKDDGMLLSLPLKSWEVPKELEMFSLADISRATEGFSKTHEIGSGGYGRVYRAGLLDGRVVAVKQALKNVESDTEFRNELQLLSRLRHRHLVRLIGFCHTSKHKILVYEYMENGNLDQRLLSTDQVMSWYQRIEIAVAVAEGLHYLHSFAEPPVIHRDLKPSNILLDSNFVAKISDFGISKATPELATHISTGPAGTAGYLDPEYFLRRQLTTASDVYSFGVVLLQLVTGQKAIDQGRRDEVNLIEWVKLRYDHGGLDSIIDSRLCGDFPRDQFAALAEIGLQCSAFEKSERPSIQEVLTMLLSLFSHVKLQMPRHEDVEQESGTEETLTRDLTVSTMSVSSDSFYNTRYSS